MKEEKVHGAQLLWPQLMGLLKELSAVNFTFY